MVKKRASRNLATKAPKPEVDNPEYIDYSEELEGRSKQWCDDEDVRVTAFEIYNAVQEGFDNQAERSDLNMDYWDLYNCILNANQFYMGNTKVYVPIVHDAVNARVTRFSNQIFPTNKRYIEVISNTNEVPNGIMALMEHYVRKGRLRTEVIPALIRCGDVEGQYTIYVHWSERPRTVVQKVKAPVMLGGEEELPDPTKEEIDDIEETTLVDCHPSIEIISDNDLCVLPPVSDSLYEALENGGSVTIIRRWSKAKLAKMVKDGEIDKEEGEKYLKEFEGGSNDPTAQRKDTPKELVDAAGIKRGARGKYAQVWETWTYLTVKLEEKSDDGEHEKKEVRRLFKIYFGGPDVLLSVKRNPLWCDRLPIVSCPVEKVHGSFKGRSKVAPCNDFQIIANDAAAEGMDSAAFSMLPIVMTDPEKNPRIGSMILSLAAIWQTSPKDTSFAQFPKLYEQAFEIINSCRLQIFQTLSVNPAMITQQQTKKKPNAAEVSQEQAVDILTTADAVTVIEDGILSPMLTLFMELDHQYRNKALSVRSYGQMGARASFEEVPEIAMDNRYSIRWFGVEQARNQAAVQAQISALNVLRGIPPQQYMPYRANFAPVLLQLVENVFGPRLAPEVFVDLREQMGLPVELENQMLQDGMPLHPHPMDNHQKHIQQHYMAMQQSGDVHGTFHAHIAEHNEMFQMATQQQVAQQMQGTPGAPGGAGKGMPGQPRQGAMGGRPPMGGQRPPGMMHQDRMPGVDPSAMPRR